MVHLEVTARIPLPIEEYWAMRITPEFLSVESRVLKNASKTISQTQIDDKGRITNHQMKTKPDLSSVPAMLIAMLPEEGIVYTDDIAYVFDDPKTPYTCRTRTTPNIASDSCNINSFMRVIVDPENAEACIQTLSLDVNVSLWMAGSAIESLIANGVREGYKKLPQIVSTYLAEFCQDNTNSGAERQISVADSDYGSLSELDISSEDLRHHGVKREHSAPSTPTMQRAKATTSGLRSILLGSREKRIHLDSGSTESLAS